MTQTSEKQPCQVKMGENKLTHKSPGWFYRKTEFISKFKNKKIEQK